MTKLENEYSVSVVIPAYNAGPYLGRCIDSVLAQTYPAAEIVVVDDGSTDHTSEIAAAYGEKVRLLRQDNAGPGAARNAGIAAAQGNWIAFLDADDQWLPEKLKLQIELLKRNPQLNWATANYYVTTVLQHKPFAHCAPDKARHLLNGESGVIAFFNAVRLELWGCTDTMLIRKSSLQQAGSFVTDMRKMEDLDMWFRIAYDNPQIGLVAEPLIIYYLDVQGSLIKSERGIDPVVRFWRKHLQLAEQKDSQAFNSCARYMIGRTIRGLIFQGRSAEIRLVLKEFGHLLTARKRFLARLATTIPRTSAFLCKAIANGLRALKVVRRPKR